MAKKKANPELQDETMRDGLDMASEGTDLPSSETMDGSGDDFPAFPPSDDAPFEDTAEGDSASQDNTPFNADGAFLDSGAVDNADPAANDGEDYSAFLQATREGGVEPVLPSENEPLLLDAANDGGDSAGNPSDGAVSGYDEAPPQEPAPVRAENRRTAPRQERDRILTIDPRAGVQTREDLEGLIWHELQNAYRTRHILTGKLDSVGRTQNGMDAAVILYKGVRVLIPLKEMMVHTGQVPSGPDYPLWVSQVTRILHARQDCDIDFIVRGIDEDSRTVVASRRDAMRRKRKRFYLDTDEQGRHMIEEGRVVQARVVAVADKLLRVEVFGVECNVSARSFSRMWVGSARDSHYVGELILVQVQKIERVNVDRITIRVDADSIFQDEGDNLSRCQPQCRYVGQVTDVRKGVVFVRLNTGVNAIAHTCYDMRMPGRKDTVSFAVTRLDEKRGVAIGIITRIIKQNL